MKIGKRLLSAALCLALSAGLVFGAAADSGDVPQSVRMAMSALDIMSGDENGDLHLGSSITRAEFAKIVVAASPSRGSVGKTASTSPFPDVRSTHWAAPYVEVSVAQGYIRGYLDGTFRPSGAITLAEGATVALRLLGYTDGDFSGVYPSGQMAKYTALDLDENVSASSPSAPLARRDAMYLIYNTLTARTKAGTVYITSLGYPVTSAGEIDLVSLINSSMEGPIVATSSWKDVMPFAINANTTVYRAGSLASASNIQTNDVLYWNKPMRTIWAYTTKVTGAYTAASPSSSSPSQVTVAGKTYAIGTAAAAFDLSDLGLYRVGDIVTLLIGRDGSVAAVAGASGSTASGLMIIGLVSATGTGTFTDKDGGTYAAKTVTITATDGSSYTYESGENKYNVGNIARASVKDGKATVSTLGSASVSGKVSSDGAKLGGYTFASDIQIIDTFEGEAMRVYPARLAGANIASTSVRYYTLNAKGEIDRLILNDWTGDLHAYGILTGVLDASAGGSVYAAYTYILNGQTLSYTSTTSKYPVDARMGVQIKGAISGIYPLTSMSISSAGGSSAMSGTTAYTLSDSVQVYEESGSAYYLSSLDRVSGGGYSLTAWYDKSETSGGRIRVIVAKAN